jgi:hypothetical protein
MKILINSNGISRAFSELLFEFGDRQGSKKFQENLITHK